jgi:hypothetical protein
VNAAVEVKDGITPSLDDLARQFPQFYKQALKDLGRRWRNTIGREMRAGAPAGQPFVPLSQLTMELRRRVSAGRVQRRDAAVAQTKTLKRARRKNAMDRIERKFKKAALLAPFKNFRAKERALWEFGGKLPDLVEYSTADGVRVGFLEGIFSNTKRAAARWMRQEQRGWSRQERRWLHMLYRGPVPFAAYSRPERQAVSPQQAAWNADAESTIRKSIAARVEASKSKQVSNFLTPKAGGL